MISTKIKRLNLSKNIMIDNEGFREICKSIRKNNYIEAIDLRECGISLEGPTGW